MSKKIKRHEVIKFLLGRIVQLTEISENEIQRDKTFHSMGLTSLDGIQLIDDLNRFLETSYSPIILFDHPTLNDLIHFILNPSSKSMQFTDNLSSKDSSDSSGPIAIIGMSCHFPGANGLEELWSLLSKGEDAVSEIPEDRWREISNDFKAWGGFIENPNSFDNKLFGIQSSESRQLDPQQRKILETAWLAIEHSGYAPQDIMGTNTGVYIGISSHDYSLSKVENGEKVSVFDGIGGAHSIAANRISYSFDFHGPSWAVDTACSSSLISIAQAVGHLRSGECDMALAGGVNILQTSHITESFNKSGMLSKTGRCRTFSDDADGYVRGEGVGLIVLKRLEDAQKDNDQIWGVIKGYAHNQDGKSNGLTAPNGKAQEAVVKKALYDANLSPDDIDYIEAHGTGTPLGDPIEYQALKNCFQDKKEDLLIGSIKTNIGHLEAAAGIAGVIKVLLAMKYQEIPQNLHFKKINSKINISNSPLKIVSEPVKLKKNIHAGVSSFGFGGTNAHIILESGRAYSKHLRSFDVFESQSSGLLLLSATSKEKMQESLASLISALEVIEEKNFFSFCYFKTRKASELDFRLSFVAANKFEMMSKLKKEMAKGSIYRKKVNSANCFVFTGQGSQYSSMHVDMYKNDPDFRLEYDRVQSLFESRHDVDFSKLYNNLKQTDNAQIALFCLEYALYKTLSKFGIEAEYYLGHSLGEIVAFSCAGGMSLADSVDLIFHRGQIMQESSVGGMLVCFLNETRLLEVLKEKKIHLSIAAVNAKEVLVLSGSCIEIEKCEKYLTELKIKNKRLSVQNGFHSYLMDSVLEKFAKKIKGIKYNNTVIPVISSVTGEIIENISESYWVDQIRKTTNFYKSCEKLNEYGIKNIIEIGSSPTLVHLCRQNINDSELVVCTLNKKQNGYESFLSFIGNLFEAGMRVDMTSTLYRKSYNWIGTPNTILNDEEFHHSEKNSLAKSNSKVLTEDEVALQIKEIVAEELDYELDQVDINLPIMNFGADSLLLLTVLDNIRDLFHVSISITDVFQDLSTIELISKHIIKNTAVISDIAASSKSIEKINDEVLDQESYELSKGVLGGFSKQINRSESMDNTHGELIGNLIKDFNERTTKSKDWGQAHRKHLADNRVSAGFRPNLKEMVYPIVWKRAQGANFWDMDGNKYIDFTMGFGVNLFGHSPDFINAYIKDQLELGMALGPQSHMAGLVAEKFCKLTGNERVAFLNSGTEAIMTSVRLARAYTQRETIIIFEGSYHGHFDGVLGRSNRSQKTVPVAPGVPLSLMQDLVVLEYGSEAAIEYIDLHGSTIAGVLIEPVQSRYPELQPGSFLKAVRSMTTKHNIALVFDEVITGFRVGSKGAQGFFDVEADIATYGKVLGGGMPIGAVAGKKEYLDFIDGGQWDFGDDSMPLNAMTFFAGTFCKHSLAMAASYAVLSKVEELGDLLFKDLDEKTKALAEELNRFFKTKNIDLEIVSFSSLFRFKYSGNMDLLFYFMNLKGIYIWEGRNLFLSKAHTEQDIKDFIKVTKEVVQYLIENSYIKMKQVSEKEILSLNMRDEHLRFCEMSLASEEGKLASKITVGIKLLGSYDAKAIQKAVEEIVNKHESLGATYNLTEKKIIFSNNKVRVSILDFRLLPNSAEICEKWLEDSKNDSFDLSRECVDINLLQISDEEAILAFSAHHIALDGLSLAMISFDIAHVYSGLIGVKKDKELKEVSFIDFLNTRDDNSEKMKTQLSYWVNQYKDLPQPIFKSKDYAGGRIAVDLTEEESHKLKFFGYRNKSSLMNTLLISLLKLLKKNFGRDEFVIGIPFAGHENISDSMVGNCVNLLPFRIKLTDDEDKEKISKIKEYQLKSFRASEVSYHQIKKEIGSDVIEIILNVEPINELPKFKNLKAELITYPSAASEYPIYINAMKIDDIVNITIDYQNTAFESEADAKNFLNSYRKYIIDVIS